jgi:hypothetical protein
MFQGDDVTVISKQSVDSATIKGDFHAKFDVLRVVCFALFGLKNESGLNRNWRSTLF